MAYRGATHTTELHILRADDIEAGSVGGASFSHHVPMTFHGNWVPSRS